LDCSGIFRCTDQEKLSNSYGIEPILYEESLGTLYGLTNTPLGEVEIFVKSSDFEKAKVLLREITVHEDDKE